MKKKAYEGTRIVQSTPSEMSFNRMPARFAPAQSTNTLKVECDFKAIQFDFLALNESTSKIYDTRIYYIGSRRLRRSRFAVRKFNCVSASDQANCECHGSVGFNCAHTCHRYRNYCLDNWRQFLLRNFVADRIATNDSRFCAILP